MFPSSIFLNEKTSLKCSLSFQMFAVNEDAQQHNAYKDNLKNYGEKT